MMLMVINESLRRISSTRENARQEPSHSSASNAAFNRPRLHSDWYPHQRGVHALSFLIDSTISLSTPAKELRRDSLGSLSHLPSFALETPDSLHVPLGAHFQTINLNKLKLLNYKLPPC